MWFIVAVAAYLYIDGWLRFLDESSMSELVVAFTVGLIYTLLPDADHPSTKIRRRICQACSGILIGALSAAIFLEDPTFLPYGLASAIVLLYFHVTTHRKSFHTPLAGALIAAPLWFYSPVVAGFAFGGFMVHLIADGEVNG